MGWTDRLRKMSGVGAAFQSFCANTSMHGWSFIGDIQNSSRGNALIEIIPIFCKNVMHVSQGHQFRSIDEM